MRSVTALDVIPGDLESDVQGRSYFKPLYLSEERNWGKCGYWTLVGTNSFIHLFIRSYIHLFFLSFFLSFCHSLLHSPILPLLLTWAKPCAVAGRSAWARNIAALANACHRINVQSGLTAVVGHPYSAWETEIRNKMTEEGPEQTGCHQLPVPTFLNAASCLIWR